jgi:hypothetical protein
LGALLVGCSDRCACDGGSMARTVGGRRIRAPKAPPRWPPRWLNVRNVRTALRWTLALVVYGLLAALTHWAHFRTPTPRLAVDPAAPGQFVAGLAMAHVQCVPRPS